jgi:hypothetical protein
LARWRANIKQEVSMPSSAVSKAYLVNHVLLGNDARWVSEEDAVAVEYVVQAQVRELVAEAAASEEDEATAGGHGNVLGEEIIR